MNWLRYSADIAVALPLDTVSVYSAILCAIAIVAAGVPTWPVAFDGDTVSACCQNQSTLKAEVETAVPGCCRHGEVEENTCDAPTQSREKCPCSSGNCCCVLKSAVGVVIAPQAKHFGQRIVYWPIANDQLTSRHDRPLTPPPKAEHV